MFLINRNSRCFGINLYTINQLIKEDDILIVDRGFRDSAGVLSELGINMEMPSFLQKGQKQHTTKEANNSRLITISTLLQNTFRIN